MQMQEQGQLSLHGAKLTNMRGRNCTQPSMCSVSRSGSSVVVNRRNREDVLTPRTAPASCCATRSIPQVHGKRPRSIGVSLLYLGSFLEAKCRPILDIEASDIV